MAILTKRSDMILRRLTGSTLIIVGIAGGVQSYTYLAELALSAGVSRYLAPLFPVSVDGLIIAGSLSLLRASLQNRRDFFAWSLVILGSALSIWGNIISSSNAGGGIVSAAVHTIPVIAMIAALEAFLSSLRHGYVQRSEQAAIEEKQEIAQQKALERQRYKELQAQSNSTSFSPSSRSSNTKHSSKPSSPRKVSSEPEKNTVHEQKDDAAKPLTTDEKQKSLTRQQLVEEKPLKAPDDGTTFQKSSDIKVKAPSASIDAAQDARMKVYRGALKGAEDESLTRKAWLILQAHEKQFSTRLASVEASEVIGASLPQTRKAIERARRTERSEPVPV